MAEQTLKFPFPTKENLMELDSIGMTYEEMAKHFESKESERTIKYCFRKYGIPHKRKTDFVREYLDRNPFKSTGEVAIKLKVSKDLVNRVRRTMPQKIRAVFEFFNNDVAITIKGHSGYAQRGYDIVCASVSSLSLFTINTLSDFDIDIQFSQKEGFLYAKYCVGIDFSYIITHSLISHLQEIENQYPNNMQVIVCYD